MKKLLTLFLAALLMLNTMVLPAMAEDDPSTEGSTATEAPKPTESNPVPETTQPTEAPSDPTTAPTETTAPAPCSHVYGEWTADEAAHGRKCTLCGHAESNAHSWAAETITVDPTCGEAGGKCKICTVCAGVLVTELIEPTGMHTFDNTCDTKCNVCGAERTVEHSFGTGWKYSGLGHWHYCTICGAAGEIKDHYPGPAATEEKEQICLTCGMVMMKKKNHSHKWDSAWSSDEMGHWHSCSGCSEQNDYADHTYTDGCDADCNDCGYVRKTAHEYDVWLSDETVHWQVCTLCSEESEKEAHTIAEDHCTVCLYESAEAHEHEYVEQWKRNEALHWQECDCGEKAQEAEHQWDEGTKEDGLITYTCEVCGAERQEEAPGGSMIWILIPVLILVAAGIAVCVIILSRKKTGRFYD